MRCELPVEAFHFSIFVQALKCANIEETIVQSNIKKRWKYFLLFTDGNKDKIEFKFEGNIFF